MQGGRARSPARSIARSIDRPLALAGHACRQPAASPARASLRLAHARGGRTPLPFAAAAAPPERAPRPSPPTCRAARIVRDPRAPREQVVIAVVFFGVLPCWRAHANAVRCPYTRSFELRTAPGRVSRCDLARGWLVFRSPSPLIVAASAAIPLSYTDSTFFYLLLLSSLRGHRRPASPSCPLPPPCAAVAPLPRDSLRSRVRRGKPPSLPSFSLSPALRLLPSASLAARMPASARRLAPAPRS